MEEDGGEQAPATIHKLSATTIQKIVSGPVIADIHSVVKELVENALDAGADRIDVSMDSGGLKKIQVKDNGSGIAKDDIPLCASRYYTSKIEEYESLDSLDTYGFRGEAINSLCQIGTVSIITKTSNDETASSTNFDFQGAIISSSVHYNQKSTGTTVIVKELFKKWPVREGVQRGQIKQQRKKIETSMWAYSLACPKVRFSLVNPPQQPWQKASVPSMGEAISRTFGVAVKNNLSLIDFENEEGWKVSGYIPKFDAPNTAEVTRAQNDRFFLFINRRPVDIPSVGKLVNKTVRAALKLMGKRFPFVVMNIEIPANTFDVNVTPDKRKLLLHQEDKILELVTAALKTTYPGIIIPGEDANESDESILNTSAGGSSSGMNTTVIEESSSGRATQLYGGNKTQGKEVNRNEGEDKDEEMEEDDNKYGVTQLYRNNEDGAGTGGSPITLGSQIIEDGNNNNGNNNNNPLKRKRVTFEEPSSTQNEVLLDGDEDDDNIAQSNDKEKEGEEEGGDDGNPKPSKQLKLSAATQVANNAPVSKIRQIEQLRQQQTKDMEDRTSVNVFVDMADIQERLESSQKSQKKKLISKDKDTDKDKDKTPSALESEAIVIASQGSSQDCSQGASQIAVPNSQSSTQTNLDQDAIKIVGPVESKGVTLFLVKTTAKLDERENLYIFNPYRAQEVIHYEKLKNTYEFNRKPLAPVLKLNEENLGSANTWKAAVSCCQNDGKKEVLLKNGFELKLSKEGENGGFKIEMVAKTDAIPNYGVSELRELVTLLESGGTGIVPRPVKVLRFFGSEAARLTNGQLGRVLQQGAADEVLKQYRELPVPRAKSCPHNRAVFEHLYSIVLDK